MLGLGLGFGMANPKVAHGLTYLKKNLFSEIAQNLSMFPLLPYLHHLCQTSGLEPMNGCLWLVQEHEPTAMALTYSNGGSALDSDLAHPLYLLYSKNRQC